MPEDPESSSPTSPSANISLSSRGIDFSIATLLIITYLIELGIQVYIVIHLKTFALLTETNDWEGWLSLGILSFVVSGTSLVWVCLGLDFQGRLMGRLLCYVIHLATLGLPWRYLKLSFAYDPTDTLEFLSLRSFQLFIESLPLTGIHLASIFKWSQTWTPWLLTLVGIEVTSILISLPLTSIKIKSTSVNSNHVFISNVTLIGQTFLLVCRLMIIGIAVATLPIWLFIIVFILHYLLIIGWIYMSGTSINRSHWDIFISSYILFWDVTGGNISEFGDHGWILPGLVGLIENGIVLGHYYFSKNGNWIVVLTLTFGLTIGGSIFYSFKCKSHGNGFSDFSGSRKLSEVGDISLKGCCGSCGCPSSSKHHFPSSIIITSNNSNNNYPKESKNETSSDEVPTMEHERIISDKDSSRNFMCTNITIVGDDDGSGGSSNSRNTNTVFHEESPPTFVFCSPWSPQMKRQPPLQIRKASRVIMNSKRISRRCPCQSDDSDKWIPNSPIIEDQGSLGILFREESPPIKSFQKQCMNFPTLTKLRVICAKCLQNHDPLLTHCQSQDGFKIKLFSPHGIIGMNSSTCLSDTTDYPSETEFTGGGAGGDDDDDDESFQSSQGCNGTLETASKDNHSPQMWKFIGNFSESNKEFTGREYVRTWLLITRSLQEDSVTYPSTPETFLDLTPSPTHRSHLHFQTTSKIPQNEFLITSDSQEQIQLGQCYKDLEIIL